MQAPQTRNAILKRNDSLQTNSIGLQPFHLSICANDLETTRYFYREIIGVREVRASKTSVHFDFYGSQLTLHEVPGYSAKNIQREVDAEDVPVPHFGAALFFEEWERIADRLVMHNIPFVSKPHLRFIGEQHEQFVMFVEDPSGNGIEIKSFTKAATRTWA
jgi:uncharacterized protein